jgi:hypothetical protein
MGFAHTHKEVKFTPLKLNTLSPNPPGVKGRGPFTPVGLGEGNMAHPPNAIRVP